MKQLYFNIAKDNLKQNHEVYRPFFISCLLMVIFFHQLASLSFSKDFIEKIDLVPLEGVLYSATIIMAIFTAIFIFYTNSFLMRQRYREFGLFSVLGMEKKQVRKVVFIQLALLCFFSVVFGLLLSSLIFKLNQLFLIKLIGMPVESTYFPAFKAHLSTIFLFIGIFIVIYLQSVAKIQLNNPIHHLLEAKAGEKPPKSNPIVAFLGILFTGIGYYLALSNIGDPIDRLFPAIFFVMIGTYCLFLALTTAFLSLLQKTDFYYRQHHFVVISGLRHRLKQNAVGMANICIMSTAVIFLLTSAVSLYTGINRFIEDAYPRQVLAYDKSYSGQDLIRLTDKQTKDIAKKDVLQFSYTSAYAKLEKRHLSLLQAKDFDNVIPSEIIYLINYEDNPTLFGEQIIKPILYDPDNRIESLFLGEDYDRRQEKAPLPSPFNPLHLNATCIVLPTKQDLKEFDSTYRRSLIYQPSDYHYLYAFNTDLDKEAQLSLVAQLMPKGETTAYRYQEADRSNKQAVFGSIFFTGIFLALVFLIAVTLIVYYKQLTEGYDDNRRFAIMTRIGMSEKEIRKIINTQILYVFFLPLVLAGIHMSVALPLLSNVFGDIGMDYLDLYRKNFLIVYVLFVFIYFFIYKTTAKTYYRRITAKK